MLQSIVVWFKSWFKDEPQCYLPGVGKCAYTERFSSIEKELGYIGTQVAEVRKELKKLVGRS